MRKPKATDQQHSRRPRRFLGAFEHLEDRCLLAPTPVFGTVFNTLANFGPAVTGFNGFVSVRLLSTQTGRLEVDPTGKFGNDVFVVSRGTPAGTGGIVPAPINVGDVPGNIYRVDPYGANAFGGSPAFNRQLFGTVPSGGTSFGGYENWYDMAFDTHTTSNFAVANGGPTLYVSSLDAATTPGINPRNAVYGFRPDGSRVTPVTAGNPSAASAFSTLDVFHPGIHDTQIGAIAVAPGDTFGRDLYLFDVACDNEVGITCDTGDGNSIFRITPANVTANFPNPINIDAPPVPLNGHLEGILPPLATPPPNNDIDIRAVAFDPNRGIILQGQFGEPAFQLYGGLYVASTDLETSDTGVSRILHFPSPGFAPVDLVTPVPASALMIGDMAFDPVGFFGGGIFLTDHVTGSVFEIIQDPVTGRAAVFLWATGFNVLCPSAVAACPAGSPAGITQAQSYRDAFSISFSANGEIMFVSDRDGIWAFYAGTYNHSASGAYTGSADARELLVPYTGKGFAAAVIDTGIDSSHLGFQNVVLPGFNPSFPGPANYDPGAHGTAVAGIMHQIAPDAVLLPIALNFGGRQNLSTAQDLYEGIRFIRDNPFVDDPRTPGRDSIPIVALNMSIGISLDEHIVDSEADAFKEDQSVVIPLKAMFADYQAGRLHPYGIAAVSSAGNFGQLWNGMSGNGLPAILNDVVSTMAVYPYGPTPPFAAPPITLQPGPRCTLEPGDNLAYPGKLTAFSNRNIINNFAAPGTCVSTYSPSFLTLGNAFLAPLIQAFVTGPILSNFNGTSAAAPNVAGAFLLGFDAISQWVAVAGAGGAISHIDVPAVTADDKMAALNRYLVRGLLAPSGLAIAPSTLNIGAAAAHLAPYLNRDGIHSILQWTAVPVEDVNIGEDPFSNPAGNDDDVIQRHQCVRNSCHRFYNYSHLNISNFLSAVEGSVALNYFSANPGELAQLSAAAGSPGFLTVEDIEVYIDDNSNSPTDRAMAHLLGGADKIARRNRMTFLDVVQDEAADGGIFTDAASLLALQSRLLPGPRDFVITDRFASAHQTYAIDSTAVRNIHDLIGAARSSILAPNVKGKLAKKSPGQITLGTSGRATVIIEPAPGRTSLPGNAVVYRVVGRAGDLPNPGLPGQNNGGNNGGNNGQNNGGNTGGGSTTPGHTTNNFTSTSDAGVEFMYHTNDSGHLLESARAADGSWSVQNLTTLAGGPAVHSDLIALDLPGAARAVLGLTADGQVVRYEYSGQTWLATNLTAAGNLPAIHSGLNALVLAKATGSITLIYGLNANGELIEYRSGLSGWTARNITADTRTAALASPLAVWGEVYRGKSERVLVYGTTADGHVMQYYWGGKKWMRFDLSALANSPTGLAGSLFLLPPNNLGGLPTLFALDPLGSLWRYTGNLRLGWEAIGGPIGGPALTGELTGHFDATSGTTYIYGVDRQGRLTQFAGRPGSWNWSTIASDVGVSGDLVASTTYRALYTELVDGAIAEFWFGDDWNMRRLNRGELTGGAPDGSTATSQVARLR